MKTKTRSGKMTKGILASVMIAGLLSFSSAAQANRRDQCAELAKQIRYYMMLHEKAVEIQHAPMTLKLQQILQKQIQQFKQNCEETA